MASQVSLSTIAPSDSASNTQSSNGKKGRPGRRQREAARSGVNPPATKTGSFISKASSAPVPQPGKFPVVFQTGVGEPSRDVKFSYDGKIIANILVDFFERLKYNPKFAEFKTHASYTDDQFACDLTRIGLLALTQQTAFSHVNMGLPLGDLGSVGSTDFFQLRSMVSILGQFGEFQAEVIGSRFVLADYPSTIAALVRAADQTDIGVNQRHVLDRMWLPTTAHDKRTRFILAVAVSNYFAQLGVPLSMKKLEEEVIHSGSQPLWFRNVCQVLPAAERTRFNFLSERTGDADAFIRRYTALENMDTLEALGLSWEGARDVNELDWQLNLKLRFGTLADELLRKKPALAKFFSLSPTLASKSDATGSLSQLSQVETIQGVSVVSTRLALSAPQLSLLACFPSSSIVQWFDQYNAIVTTTINLEARATEFVALDWLS